MKTRRKKNERKEWKSLKTNLNSWGGMEWGGRTLSRVNNYAPLDPRRNHRKSYKAFSVQISEVPAFFFVIGRLLVRKILVTVLADVCDRPSRTVSKPTTIGAQGFREM